MTVGDLSAVCSAMGCSICESARCLPSCPLASTTSTARCQGVRAVDALQRMVDPPGVGPVGHRRHGPRRPRFRPPRHPLPLPLLRPRPPGHAPFPSHRIQRTPRPQLPCITHHTTRSSRAHSLSHPHSTWYALTTSASRLKHSCHL